MKIIRRKRVIYADRINRARAEETKFSEERAKLIRERTDLIADLIRKFNVVTDTAFNSSNNNKEHFRFRLFEELSKLIDEQPLDSSDKRRLKRRGFFNQLSRSARNIDSVGIIELTYEAFDELPAASDREKRLIVEMQAMEQLQRTDLQFEWEADIRQRIQRLVVREQRL